MAAVFLLFVVLCVCVRARLYRGLPPACLRHVVYSGTRVGAYEYLREHVLGRDAATGDFALWKGVVCGMGAGAVGQFVASPTDIVKTQMQLEGRALLAGARPRFRGTLDAFRVIAREGASPHRTHTQMFQTQNVPLLFLCGRCPRCRRSRVAS